MHVFSTRTLSSLTGICVLFSLSFSVPAFSQLALPNTPAAPTKPQPPPPAVRQAAKQWDLAVKLQKGKRYTEAVTAYKEFLKTLETNKLPASSAVPAYQNLTAIYRSQGKVQEAEDSLEKWSALDPNNAAVHAELAAIYATSKNHRFDEAAREANRALALRPNAAITTAAHSTLGIVAVARKDFATAEQEFGSAIKLSPNNAQMMYNYGLALVERKKFVPALAAMQKAAALNPRMAPAHYYVGLLSEALQKYPEALQSFKMAAHLAPTDPTIRFDMARVMLRTGALQDAITSYLVVLEQAPQSLPARIAVAQCYVQLQNYAAGRVHYELAAKQAPKNAQVLAGLAQCETELSFQPRDAAARTELLKKAEEHYRAAEAIDPKRTMGQNSLVRFYERTGSFDKAQEIYRKRIEADPNDFTNYNFLAQTYLMQRKPVDAIATWRKFQSAHPGNPMSYARVAETLETEGKFADAAAEWKLLLGQKLQTGTAASVMTSAGKDLMRAGKNSDAAAQFEAVLKLDATASDAPKEVRVGAAATIQAERLEAMRQLAKIAEQDKKLDEAIRLLQQVKAEEATTVEKSHGSPNPQTYREIARLYQSAKKPDLAIKELDALTQTKQAHREDFAPAFEDLAQVYESLNRFDDAIGAYRRAAQFAREPLNYRLRVAEVYQRSGRLPLAITEFEAMHKEFPNESRVMAPMALAYRQAGRDEDALRTYDALMQADPNARWALDQKAAVLTHMKRFSDARAVYEDQLKHSPENRQLYADVDFVFQSEGKPDAFLDWALPRFEKSPQNATLMAVVLEEYTRQKKEEQGWQVLRASAEKHKSLRPLVEATASLMAQRGRKDDAVALYRQIAAQYPNDLNAQLTLADQLANAGHRDEAAKLYATLIARSDLGSAQKLVVRRQFARCCAEQGNTVEELAQLAEIVKADPDDFDSATRLAQELEKAGRETEAIPVLLSLANREIYPPIVRGQIHTKVGNLYLKKGEKTDAAAQFHKALELNEKDTAAEQALKGLDTK